MGAALSEAGVNKAQLAAAVEEGRGGATVDSATADLQFEALSKYGIDLTAKAAELDPVIGERLGVPLGGAESSSSSAAAAAAAS